MTRYSYRQLVELVDGDHELIARLVAEGEIERDEDDCALVDVDRVLVAHTLVRELGIDWPGVELALRLLDQLGAARRRIVELEAALARPPRPPQA